VFVCVCANVCVLQLSLSVSLKYLSQAQTIACHTTAIRGALFGTDIAAITRFPFQFGQKTFHVE